MRSIGSGSRDMVEKPDDTTFLAFLDIGTSGYSVV